MFAYHDRATVCRSGQGFATNENESRFEIIGKSSGNGKTESAGNQDHEIWCLPNAHRTMAGRGGVKARTGRGLRGIAANGETKAAAAIEAKFCAKSLAKKPCVL
jgi:hypothetical protein